MKHHIVVGISLAVCTGMKGNRELEGALTDSLLVWTSIITLWPWGHTVSWGFLKKFLKEAEGMENSFILCFHL